MTTKVKIVLVINPSTSRNMFNCWHSSTFEDPRMSQSIVKVLSTRNRTYPLSLWRSPAPLPSAAYRCYLCARALPRGARSLGTPCHEVRTLFFDLSPLIPGELRPNYENTTQGTQVELREHCPCSRSFYSI